MLNINMHDTDNLERFGRIVAHQITVSRQALDQEIKQMFQQQEKQLLQILDGQREGCLHICHYVSPHAQSNTPGIV